MVETRAADPLLDTMLGKNYRVVESIGLGGMAEVYLVEHVTLHKQFAAKVLQAAHATSAEARARFTQEAHAASQLDHENIVTITDFGLTGCGRPYFVMELLRGQTLAERLDEGPLTLEEVVAITIPAVRGLAHAHAEGVIHRDVKPENIFLVQRSQGRWGVKVLDFGIAKVSVNDNMTASGQALGSPMYMSPEACRGDDIDARADVYSFGILLYLMLAGREPFRDDNILKVLQMQVLDQPPPPTTFNPNLPTALEDVILRALSKEPDDRYANMDELLAAFEEALPEGSDVLLLQAHLGGAATPLPGSLERVSILPRTITASGKFFTVDSTGRHNVAVREKAPSSPPVNAAETRPIAHPPAPDGGKKLGVALVAVLVLGGAGAAAYVLSQRGREPVTEVASPSVTKVAEAQPPAAAPVLPPRKVGPAIPDPVPLEPTELTAPPDVRDDDAPARPGKPPKGKAAKLAAGPKAASKMFAAKTTATVEVARPTVPDAGTPIAATPPPPAPVTTPPEPVTADPAPTPAKPPPPAKPAAPATPAAPAKNIGSLDAKLTITSIDVAGSLPTSIVRRAVERALPSLRECYQAAAKQKQTTPALTMTVRFEIDEGASARSVSATGATLGSLASCAKSALQQVQSPQAPDVGTVQVALAIRFTPL